MRRTATLLSMALALAAGGCKTLEVKQATLSVSVNLNATVPPPGK